MPFNAFYLTPSGEIKRGLGESQIREALQSADGLLWLDICDITEDDGRLLERVFNFHHLAVEDCLSRHVHTPKIDNYGDYLFVVVHGINYAVQTDFVETTEIQIFLGRYFVVSVHTQPMYSVDSVQKLVDDDARPMRRGAALLAHALVDALIDNIMPTVDAMSIRADEIEEEVIRNPQRSTLEAILQLKRSAARLHRVATPQKDVLNRLSRREFPLIREDDLIFYRDIYDHISRIEELNQSVRDRASDALSTYMSSVANRQNETMRVLSIVATIFLPMMLLAGIYGMNFEYLPELGWKWSYFAVLGFMATVIIGALMWFRARNWITYGRREVRRLRPLMVDRARLIGHWEHVTAPHRHHAKKAPD
jgi:magnesium transporter